MSSKCLSCSGWRKKVGHGDVPAADPGGGLLGDDQRAVGPHHFLYAHRHRHGGRLRDSEEAEFATGAGGLQTLVDRTRRDQLRPCGVRRRRLGTKVELVHTYTDSFRERWPVGEPRSIKSGLPFKRPVFWPFSDSTPDFIRAAPFSKISTYPENATFSLLFSASLRFTICPLDLPCVGKEIKTRRNILF